MCDTISVYKTFTSGGENLLMKNSDRPLGECQPLVAIPGENGKYALIGSKPYWINGFEMGVNEKGLFIGNEAQGSRCQPEKEEGMLGMDMLRIALEKSSSCREAISVLSGLLSEYGQNANASRLFDRRYENSFILTDRDEGWVMETAGREWAARRIQDAAAVSNCYTIGTDYDLCSERMEKTVREHRWVRPCDPVDFAKAYTLPAARQRNSLPRKRRMEKLLARIFDTGCKADFENLSEIFRDHSEDEVNAPRHGNMIGNNVSVCMHACSWEEAQTAASMGMTYDPETGSLRLMWAPGTPCTAVYIPVCWIPEEIPKLPLLMSTGGEFYEEGSLWWKNERLSLLVSVDEDRFAQAVWKDFSSLRSVFRADEKETREKAAARIRKGRSAEAQVLFDEMTERCTARTLDHIEKLTGDILEKLRREGGLYGPKKEFVESYADRSGMRLERMLH